MISQQLVARVQVAGRFFGRSTRCFTDEDATFAPKGDLYTVAAHVEHTAGSIDWFIHGMFSPDGFDLDFDRHIAEARACTSLADARAHLERSIENATRVLGGKSDEELMELLPEDSIFASMPRAAVIDGLVDHTAHHRGALTVYARLLGKTPSMPYE
jgi:uncharacterized damage-inducible protein DinB